jgi:hypothetical protein
MESFVIGIDETCLAGPPGIGETGIREIGRRSGEARHSSAYMVKKR